MTKVHDLGEPADLGGEGPDSAGVASTVASRLMPLLARAGLRNARILRVLALCPTEPTTAAAAPRVSGGGRVPPGSCGEIPGARDWAGADKSAAAAGPDPRDPGGGDRWKEGGIGLALRPASGSATADPAVVIVKPDGQTPLGVAALLRRALLWGNRLLCAALQVDASCLGGALSGGVTPAVALGSPGPGWLGGDAAASGAGGGRVVVVGADPGLLLSSLPILWTLQLPFDGFEGFERAHPASPVARRSGGDSADGVAWMEQARGGKEGTGGTSRARQPTAGHDGRDAEGGEDSPGCWRDRSDESDGSDGSEAGGLHGAGDCERGANRHRRDDLARVVSWLGARPVGSRVYYCLEEVLCGRSRSKARMPEGSRGQGVGSEKEAEAEGASAPDFPQGESRLLAGQSRPGVPSAEQGSHRPAVHAQAADPAEGKPTPAMLFAREVSEVLAAVYAEHPRDVEQEPDEERPGVAGVAASRCWVVKGTADKHRRVGLLKKLCGFEPARHVLTFLASYPDVLVVEAAAAADGRRRRAKGNASHAGGPARGGPGDDVTRTRKGECLAGCGETGWGEQRAPVGDDGRNGGRSPRRVLHLASAQVFHLLGTSHCREFVGSLPEACGAELRARYAGWRRSSYPVPRLYVPLALPPLPPAGGPSRATGAEEGRNGLDGTSARTIGCPATKASAAGARAPSGRRGRPPLPLIGALVHPVPVRATRELLQVYVATTRAGAGRVSTASRRSRGDGTSGLFSTSRLLLPKGSGGKGPFGRSLPWRNPALGGSSGGAMALPPRGGEGGRGEGSEVAAVPPSAIDCIPDSLSLTEGARDYGPERWRSGRPRRGRGTGSGEAPSVRRSRSPGHGRRRGGGNDARVVGPGEAAHTNPPGPLRLGGGSAADNDDLDGGLPHDASARISEVGPNVEGGRLRERRRRSQSPGPETGAKKSGEGGHEEGDGEKGEEGEEGWSCAGAPMEASLQRPFRRSYVAVLSREPPLTAAPSSGGGGGVGSTVSTGPASHLPPDPLSRSSAVLMQLHVPIPHELDVERTTQGHSVGVGPRGVDYGAAELRASGDGDGIATVGDVPAVCSWRGCLADAVLR